MSGTPHNLFSEPPGSLTPSLLFTPSSPLWWRYYICVGSLAMEEQTQAALPVKRVWAVRLNGFQRCDLSPLLVSGSCLI